MFKEKIIIEMKEVFKEIPFGIEHQSDKSGFGGVIDENCRSYRKQKTIS